MSFGLGFFKKLFGGKEENKRFNFPKNLQPILLLQDSNSLIEAFRLAIFLRKKKLTYKILSFIPSKKAFNYSKRSGISYFFSENLNDLDYPKQDYIYVLTTELIDNRKVDKFFTISFKNQRFEHRILELEEAKDYDGPITLISYGPSIFNIKKNKLKKSIIKDKDISNEQLFSRINSGNLKIKDIIIIFKKMLEMSKNQGMMSTIMNMINMPFKINKEMIESLKSQILIMNAMTDKEKNNPDLLNDLNRVKRISRGTKKTIEEVQNTINLIKFFLKNAADIAKKSQGGMPAIMEMMKRIKGST